MKEWKKVKLGDVCKDITVGHVGTMADKYTSEGVLFLRSQNIQPYKLNLNPSQVKFIPTEFHKKLKKSALSEGDLVIVRTGYPGTSCVIPSNLGEVNCSDLVIVRPSSELADPNFLCYYINSPLGKGAVLGNLVGAAQQHFNITMAQKMSLCLPPLPIQQKIASILSAYDDLIENNNRRIALLEKMAGNIYKEWFVRMRFPGYEKAKFVDGLPEGWESLKIAEILENVSRKKKLQTVEYKPEGKFPIIDQGDKFIAGFTNDEEAVFFSPLPLLVFGDHTRRLKYVNFPFASGADGTQVLYPKNKDLLPLYFYYAIKSVDLSDFAYARHFKFLKEKKIIIPKGQILTLFNDKANCIYKLINLINQKNTFLSKVRDRLLPQLISGKLSVEHLIQLEKKGIEKLDLAAEPLEKYKKM